MTNILTNALQFGQELTPGVFTMQADDLSHLTFLESATGSIGGDPQGENFKIRVNYRDKSVSTEWEIMYASYDNNGGTISMERNIGGTIYSSNSGAPVDFSSAGAGELAIFGTFSDEEFKPEDWRPVGGAGQPSFENGWTNFGSDLANVHFRRNGRTVDVVGSIKDGSGNTVFTLPEGYRPVLGRIPVACVSSNGSMLVNVFSNGSVSLGAGQSSTFSSIAFSFPI